MTPGGGADLPLLFLDRSLGRIQVPSVLRAAGLDLVTLAEVYGIPADEGIADETWLTRAGQEGWVVLMKDERIRHRPVERRALLDHGVRAFCLARRDIRAAEMAGLFLAAHPEITRACSRPGPLLGIVSQGALRMVDLRA